MIEIVVVRRVAGARAQAGVSFLRSAPSSRPAWLVYHPQTWKDLVGLEKERKLGVGMGGFWDWERREEGGEERGNNGVEF